MFTDFTLRVEFISACSAHEVCPCVFIRFFMGLRYIFTTVNTFMFIVLSYPEYLPLNNINSFLSSYFRRGMFNALNMSIVFVFLCKGILSHRRPSEMMDVSVVGITAVVSAFLTFHCSLQFQLVRSRVRRS